ISPFGVRLHVFARQIADAPRVFSISAQPCRLGWWSETAVPKGEAMKRFSLVSSLTAMLALGGCKMIDGSEFAGSTPSAENVALAVPANGNTQSALTDGTKVSAL